MAKTIEVIVSAAGEVKIDAVGFKGADCEKATAFLEKALGQVSTKTKKPEYHAQARNVQKIGG
jgi:hypothetical protein